MSSRARQNRQAKRQAQPAKEKFHIFKVGELVSWNRYKEQLHYDWYHGLIDQYGNGPFPVLEVIQRDDNGPDEHPQKIKIAQGQLPETGDWYKPVTA